MEFDIKRYWWVIAVVVVVLFVLMRKSSAGYAQSGTSGTDYTLQAAQLSATQQANDAQNRFAFANALLSYDIAKRQESDSFTLGQQQLQLEPQLAQLQYQNQAQLAALQANTQNFQLQQQLAAQQYNLQNAYNMQRRTDWINAISQGVQTIVPDLFMNATNGGGIFGTDGGLFGGGWGGGLIWS